jgi:hypothetical protein
MRPEDEPKTSARQYFVCLFLLGAQHRGMFNVTPSERRKRAYVRRTADPRFNALAPGNKIFPVDLATARSFVNGARRKGWVVWRRKLGMNRYEVGRDQ